ncbi:MAG: Mrp/NBP35 family ATP-binding protein [Clostridia bacterium]|nr:Mrp/NBP35 family ATP-binding protein [Clostridia bacterium]MBQ3870324.1 Mrp/NBP35 family ATP-binding protein [Clostridia bacterium]
MAENCNHDCSSCKENCSSRKIEKEPCNKHSNIKHVIGVVSGKGGVGKSLVTSLLAVEMRRRGYTAAILDADVTGPSIPKAFGLHGLCDGDENGILPFITKSGTRIISVNLLLENEKAPVVWRGPIISGTVKQFWTDVVWGDVDYMFIDMPPGTGDVPLTVFQSLPLTGIVIVTSPQELVSLIVSKAVNMASMMNIPVYGIVENFSYFKCPDCGKEHKIFGSGATEAAALEFDLPILSRIPIDPSLAELCDNGKIEDYEGDVLSSAADYIESV